MTVIACDGKTMVSDSQMSSGNLILHTDKIFIVEKSIVGVCGRIQEGIIFKEWFKDQSKPKPELHEDFEALVLQDDGKMFFYENKCAPHPVHELFIAIGTGSEIAMGAMSRSRRLTGEADPESAVEIACQYMDTCCLPVVVKSF